MPGTGTHLDVVRLHPGPKKIPGAEQRTKTRPDITGSPKTAGRSAKSGTFLPRNIEFGDRPCRDHAEHEVEADRNRGDGERQPDSRERLGIEVSAEKYAPTPFENACANTTTSGKHTKMVRKRDRDRDDDGANQPRLGAGSPVPDIVAV